MIHLLIVILDDLGRMPTLLRAWQAIGLPGVTILESAGVYRTTTWLSRVGLGALDQLPEAEEIRRRTLLVAIDDDALLEQAMAEAEGVVGGFDRPDIVEHLARKVAAGGKLFIREPIRPLPQEEILGLMQRNGLNELGSSPSRVPLMGPTQKCGARRACFLAGRTPLVAVNRQHGHANCFARRPEMW